MKKDAPTQVFSCEFFYKHPQLLVGIPFTLSVEIFETFLIELVVLTGVIYYFSFYNYCYRDCNSTCC